MSVECKGTGQKGMIVIYLVRLWVECPVCGHLDLIFSGNVGDTEWTPIHWVEESHE